MVELQGGAAHAVTTFDATPARLLDQHPLHAAAAIRDPLLRTKNFSLSHEGVTRSLERAREEARKCVLLCANCHAEVEAGVRVLEAPPGGFEPPRTD